MDDADQILEERLKRKREQQRRWRAANPEKDRAKVAAWAKANPEKRRSINKRYREANADRIRERKRKQDALRRPRLSDDDWAARKAASAARQQAYYKSDRYRELQNAYREANREKCRGLVRMWRLANPEKRRSDRKARKIKNRETTKAQLLKLQRGRCAICREKLGADLHIDHIMPRKLGGSNARSNLQLTHPTCNIVKSAKHPMDHARSLGRLI